MDETADHAPVWSRQPCAESSAVYEHALRQRGVAADGHRVGEELGLSRAAVLAAIDALRSLHLLREQVRSGRRWLVPVDPEIATASLISPIDEEVHRRRATISRIRQHIGAFRPHYEQTRPDDGGCQAIEELSGHQELAGHLYLAAQRCTSEFVAFRPNQWLHADGQSARQLMPGGPAMLDRGVTVRLLLQHAVRTDIRARAELDSLISRGAEVRTTGQLDRQLMVFDTDVAFLLDDGGQPGPTGVMIRNASAVRLLLDLVESSWNAADPYWAKKIGYHEVTDHLHRTIIQLLAEGLTDDAVARRLGISVRTCRRHIATVLRDLNAVSRFQAGVRVGVASRTLRVVG